MLDQGDYSLDSVQMCTGDTFKEALRQTMVSQEVMFRKQVLELHRVYGVQRIMMQNFCFEEFDRCNFEQVGTKPTFMSYANLARYDPFMKESEVSSVRTLRKSSAQHHKLRHRPLDLQLPADQYVSLIEPDLQELDLSLDLGMGHREKESDEEISLHKKSRCMLFEEVIDLEDSIDEDAENVYSLDLNVPTTECTESENSHGHISSDNLLIENKKFGRYLDLNEVFNDDSSCHSNDPIMTHDSTSSLSPHFEGAVGKVQQQANCSSPVSVKEKNNCSTESSTLEQEANLDAMDCDSRNETHTKEPKFKGNAGEMHQCQCDDAPIESIEKSSKDSSNCCGDENKKLKVVTEPFLDASHQKSEECYDGSHGAEDGGDSGLMVSVMSTCNAENDSCGERKVQNLILPDNQSSYESQKELHSTETIFSSEQVRRPSGCIESKDDEESSEIKLLLRNAAESLVSMSLADSTLVHYCNSNTQSTSIGKVQVDQPEHSSDSFELLVLKQAENNEEDEFSVSSLLSGVTEVENKNFGVKLRRGRRMKDFQREILPSLSCLSRHEICEDINIMEAVLRSREYRKIRGKMQDGQKWCASTKSKRSRLNTARRRIIL